MKTRCPYCRTPVDAPDSPGSLVECPKCQFSFHPKKAREESPPDEMEGEEGDGEAGGLRAEARPGKRSRPRRGKRPLFEDWHDPEGRRRNARKIAGVLFTVIFLVAALVFYIGRPMTAGLDLHVEIEAPDEVAVEANPRKDYRYRRRGADIWDVSMKVLVTNTSGKTLRVGKVQVRFYDEDGKRVRPRGPSMEELLPLDSMGTGLGFFKIKAGTTYNDLFAVQNEML